MRAPVRTLLGASLAAVIAISAPTPHAHAAESVSSALGVVVRALDKLSGETQDLELVRGRSTTYGKLTITLGDCRYPTDDPSSEAYAWLEVRDRDMSEPAFSGWMLASSPALHAMDHPRYDLWVLRCNRS